MLSITPIYLAIAVFVFSALAFTVIGKRRRLRISIGDGGNSIIAHLIRGHGNFAEYVPLALLALAVAELTGVSASVLHAAGVSLTVGRLLHAYYFLQAERILKLRVAGMMLTFFSLWSSSIASLWHVM